MKKMRLGGKNLIGYKEFFRDRKNSLLNVKTHFTISHLGKLRFFEFQVFLDKIFQKRLFVSLAETKNSHRTPFLR